MRASIELLNELIDRFAKATLANGQTAGRTGSLVRLTQLRADDVFVGGDLHGNRTNYHKLAKAADLEHHPRRHLVLQEVVHGGATYPNGGCMSHMLLEDVAAFKVAFPDRFHFLLCNHELAECTRESVVKAGVSQLFAFASGLEYAYGKAAGRIAEGYHDFIKSCPLAVRTDNGVFISHSLPDEKGLARFDARVFARDYHDADLIAGGSAHALIWGRQFDEPHVARFARLVGADVIITGHEPTPTGYHCPNSRQIILDASGAECWCCRIAVGKPTSATELAAALLRM